jgi:hypothetical protein
MQGDERRRWSQVDGPGKKTCGPFPIYFLYDGASISETGDNQFEFMGDLRDSRRGAGRYFFVMWAGEGMAGQCGHVVRVAVSSLCCGQGCQEEEDSCWSNQKRQDLTSSQKSKGGGGGGVCSDCFLRCTM